MKRGCFLLFIGLVLLQPAFGMEETLLLRFPTIHGNQIVFSYAGDLYSAPSAGGVARRLTSHDGYEMFARFSQDGKWIAFTGQYDGNTEVYVMPSEGGIPKRLTYTSTLGRDNISDRMGPNNLVMGWNHSQEIVFRSRMKSYNDFNGELFLASTGGDLARQIPVPRGGFCSFSPDDQKMAYNRIFREFRTWKRYRGGMADDIWIYDFKTQGIENITNNPALDIIPMWHENRIYFLSDRDDAQRMNLYVYDIPTRATRKLTNFTEYDIKFPSLGNDAIVFENGGAIYRFDLKSETEQKVQIFVANDLNDSRTTLLNVGDQIQQWEISPDGKRALFGARGDVFTVPAENGPTRNLTATCGVHERGLKWSPNGKWISFISDASGEDEITLIAQDGKGKPVQITSGNDTYMYQPIWSPDGKKLLWADRRQRLRCVDIDTKKIQEVAQSRVFEFNDYVWSPDSKWIAYTLPEEEVLNRIYLYSLESGKSVPVTDGLYGSGQPVFSSDGKYLFFVSNRDFNPTYSNTEFNHIYQDMSRIYLLTLSKKTPSPFAPKSDEVAVKEEAEDKTGKTEKGKEPKAEEKKPENVTEVDLDGITGRIIVLPLQPSNYFGLGSAGKSLYYVRRGSRDRRPVFAVYDFEAQKETELGSINGYEISADGSKMLVAMNNTFGIIPLPRGPVSIDKPIDTSGMQKMLNRRREWAQVFDEAWRQMREFFYAPNMHGLDWKATAEKYRPLVKHVNHGADLAYIIGEMIGELNVGHSYVTGGDMPQPERIPTGQLGAQLERHAASGAYRIVKILKGENWQRNTRSPLTEVGVDVSEGDYILAVNGMPTKEMKNIYASLVNSVGKQVRLTVNAKPEMEGSREIVVLPIDNESDLYYLQWVRDNIRKVTEATNGKVGYLHIPDMSPQGLNEFVKYFYPQLLKKALIIDVRGNGGGNVSPMIIERLQREIAMVDMARNTIAGTDPGGMLYGPKVCLLDEFSASDGDIFPYRFKKHNLGKLIGKRSWGGVVGIRGSLPLLDGTQLNKPEFAPYDAEGKGWIMEGTGVEPDIWVDNDPAKEFAGIDEQLNKAIEVILEELKTQEKTLPPIPPYPDKTPKKK